MARAIWLAGILTCATALAAAAQTPSTTTSSTTDTSKEKITVVGCLQDGLRTSTGTSGRDSAGAGSYVLTNAVIGSESSSSSTTTAAATTATPPETATGTTGTVAPSTASYELDGRESDLKNHVGHRIEVSGTLQNDPAPSATSTTTSGSASSRMDGNTQRLQVSSVRLVSSECSPK